MANKSSPIADQQLFSTANLWGIEGSELVAPIIYLWRAAPGGIYLGANGLTGVLPHGVKVQVLSKRIVTEDIWYCVQAEIYHHGEIYPQVGWVKGSLVRVGDG